MVCPVLCAIVSYNAIIVLHSLSSVLLPTCLWTEWICQESHVHLPRFVTAFSPATFLNNTLSSQPVTVLSNSFCGDSVSSSLFCLSCLCLFRYRQKSGCSAQPLTEYDLLAIFGYDGNFVTHYFIGQMQFCRTVLEIFVILLSLITGISYTCLKRGKKRYVFRVSLFH